jgi:DNA topoisomerase-1
MIIFRKGDKGNYSYVDSKNNKITDKEILEYIKNLVIPPNYKNTKIFYQKNGQPKILYQGYDTKDRLQRIYSAEWNVKAAKRKFCELLNFANQIKKIVSSVKEQMAIDAHTKNKMIAMIIRIVMVCYFRIGNKRYQELYGSFGAMNIQKRHVKFSKNKNKKQNKDKEHMNITFSGKKGVMNSCDIYDPLLIQEMKKLLQFREDNEMIFQWNDSGVKIPVRAIDVNHWLNNFDRTITSKMFRTYDANIFLIIFLRAQIPPDTLTINKRKKIVVSAMKEISKTIHNTPAILKKNYTASGIINLYINEPMKFKRYFMSEDTPRQAFIKYLRDYCKNYKSEKEQLKNEGAGGL